MNLFTSEFTLKSNDKEYSFPLYKDEDIGFNKLWQIHVKESRVDEDVDTDKEQLTVADQNGLRELKEGIELIRSGDWKRLRNKPNIRIIKLI